MKRLSILLIAVLSVAFASAQLHYKTALGIEAGSLNGFSVRTFPNANRPHRAFQFDLGYKLERTFCGMYLIDVNYGGVDALGLLNNVSEQMLQMSFYWSHQDVVSEFHSGDLNWYAGGGFFLGSNLAHIHRDEIALGSNFPTGGNLGFGLQTGMEYVFANAPVHIGLDFRPGACLYAYYTGTDKSDPNEYEYGYLQLVPMFDWSLALSVRFRIGDTTGTRNVAPREKNRKPASSSSSLGEQQRSSGSTGFSFGETAPRTEEPAPAETAPAQEEKKSESSSNAYSF